MGLSDIPPLAGSGLFITIDSTAALYKLESKAPNGVNMFIDDILVIEFAETLSGIPPPTVYLTVKVVFDGALP